MHFLHGPGELKQAAIKVVAGIHVLLLHSLFADDIPRNSTM